MLIHKPIPAASFENLRERIDRFFSKPLARTSSTNQLTLDIPESCVSFDDERLAIRSAAEFMGLIADSLPAGDLYLFGGILRDFALFGRKGFNSDIDLVVEGDWDYCIPYLVHLGAKRNKFGGYRLSILGQPIDIWNARETWAIKSGLIEYQGIASLTETTVLNWDSILMNWRTKRFICNKNYLEEIKERVLDIVLESNPNPLGAAVRVFRHLCSMDARKITPKAAKYLEKCTKYYTFQELTMSEIRSYGNTVIELAIFRFFEELSRHTGLSAHEKMDAASEVIQKEGLALSQQQRDWVLTS